MAGLLVEGGLRLREFPGIELRDPPIGHRAFVAGVRLRLWQVAAAAPAYQGQVAAIAEQFGLAAHVAGMALAYAQANPVAIAAGIEDSLARNRRIEALETPLRTAEVADAARPAQGARHIYRPRKE
jgi:hypothetical protein